MGEAATPAGARRDVLTSLPRPHLGARLAWAWPVVGVVPHVEVPWWQVLARYVRWNIAIGRMLVRVVLDRLGGDDSPRTLGIQLRRMYEEMGGTATKMGQQVAMRVDMLPYEACQELAKLTDGATPFSFDEARAAMEASFGKTLEEVFEAFDPDPIGAASIACVYQARRHGGQRVAVKVKRPGIGRKFAADLRAFGWYTRLLEMAALVRPGFFSHLREELRDMFLEELDFRQEARFQGVFRRGVRVAGLESWLDAPRVHTDLSSDGVMVSDFAEGVSCQDVLDAVEAKDPVALAELAEMGIEPKRVAWNVQMLAFWGQHEAPIFHADPHPGNIIVQPGNRVVMIDFGACGMTNELVAMLGRRVAVRLKRMDPAGAADAAVIQSQPYPRMALHAYMDAAHRTFLKWFQGGQDPEAAWWERSTATVWLSFVDIAREHEIPVNLNSLRLIRCTLLYDTMATRLDPEIPLSIFQDYLDESAARMMARNSGQLRQRASGVEGTWAQPPMRTTLDRAVASIRRIDAASMQFRWAMLARHGVGWEVLRALRLGAIVGITFLTSLAVPALAVALALFGDDLSASHFGSGGLLLESPLPWLAGYLGWLVATRMLRNRLERVAPRAA